MLRKTGLELVEAQSRAADFEERLIATEAKLINCKAQWANSEHSYELVK